MGFRKRDDGQIILLAGILLVLAFIAFSVQLAVLNNLGQQVGRETTSPLLEDFLVVRRTLQTAIPDELTDSSGVVRCPDYYEFGFKVRGLLVLQAAQEANRGNAMAWSELTVGQTGLTIPGLPSTTPLIVNTTIAMADGTGSVTDRVSFLTTCSYDPIIPPACLPQKRCTIY